MAKDRCVSRQARRWEAFPPRAFLFAPAFAIKPDRLQKPLQPPARLDGCALSIALGDPSGFRAEATGAGLIARMVVTLPLRSCSAWAGRRDRRHPYPGRHVKNLALPYERVWEVCAPSLSIYVGGRQCIRTCPAKAPWLGAGQKILHLRSPLEGRVSIALRSASPMSAAEPPFRAAGCPLTSRKSAAS